ncbi:hypothetical protein TRVA0_026S01772 [Trichomonascus vanleenenianus]|uniref:uncharacterized protein n=1 Tax=Trichomonascus vanleenenianus TaxID=2268995 RepID=UPI003EC9E641
MIWHGKEEVIMIYPTVAKKTCSSQFLRNLAHKAAKEFRTTYSPGQLGPYARHWPPPLPAVGPEVEFEHIFHPVLNRDSAIGLLPQSYHCNRDYTLVGGKLVEAWLQLSLYMRYPFLYANEMYDLADAFTSTEHLSTIAQHLQLHTALDQHMPDEDRTHVQDWSPVYANTFRAYMGAIGSAREAEGIDFFSHLNAPYTRILDRLLRERVSDPQIAERLVYSRPDPTTLSIPDFPAA